MPSSPYATPHPFAPMTEAEWRALAPFLARATPGPGRPLQDPRSTIDAMFFALLANRPWSSQGAESLHRKFRRWAHAGLWTRLLTALPETPALQSLAYRLCRAFRAAIRILGVPGIALARKLRLFTALPAPPWMLPDPILSEYVIAEGLRLCKTPALLTIPVIRALRYLHLAAGGRRIRRAMAPP